MLESGGCDVFVSRPGDLVPKKVKSYGPGSAFGELALLYAAPRAATVTSTAPCKLWVAERRVVGTIKRHFAEKVAAMKLGLLDRVPMLGCLTDPHKQLLAGALGQAGCLFLLLHHITPTIFPRVCCCAVPWQVADPPPQL